MIVSEPGGVGWIEDHQRQYREFYQAFPDAWMPSEQETNAFFGALGPETSVEVRPDGAFSLSLGQGVALDVFPTPEEAPEFYVDYDETGPYSAEIGESECAT